MNNFKQCILEALALTPATRTCARGRFRDFLIMCRILFAYPNSTSPHDSVAIRLALLGGAQRLNIEFVLLLRYVPRATTRLT